MSIGRPWRKPVCNGLAVAFLLSACSCNLWPGGLGHVDLPYAETRVRRIDQAPIDEASATESSESLDEGVERIKEVEAPEEGELPKEVADLELQPVPMSVADLRLRVLANNLDLAVAKLAPSRAAQKVSEEEGKFDAVLGGRLRYDRKDSPKRDNILVEFDALDDDPALEGSIVKFTEIEQEKELSDLAVGITVPLPTGGKIEVETSLFQKDTFEPANFEEYVAATKFSFSQPLLRGGGTAVNLAPIRIARAGERMTQVKTKLAAMRILARAEKAYWKLYAARKLLEIRSEQFRLASENLELVRLRVQQGVTAPIEIQRSQVGVAKRLEALIVAGTDWRLAQRSLKTYLADDALPLRGEPMIDVTTDPLLVGVELDADTLVEQALAERLDLIGLEIALVREGLRIDARRNELLPIVNLDFKFGVIDRRDSFPDAFSEQFDGDNTDVGVGITFAVPFTNQRNRARLEQALLSRAMTLASKQARELKVRQEVYDSVDRLQQNWQRILAARQNVVVAALNYQVEQQQFLLGFRTQREVLEALSDLGSAQVREIKAIVAYQVSQIDVAFATGTLLGYSRVDLAPLGVPAATEGR